MSRTSLDYNPKALSAPRAGQKEATRELIQRVLAAIEVELGEPFAWRLFQLTVAMAEFRVGRYDAAAALAQRAMLPRDQIPPDEAAELSGLPLGVVRHQVRTL